MMWTLNRLIIAEREEPGNTFVYLFFYAVWGVGKEVGD